MVVDYYTDQNGKVIENYLRSNHVDLSKLEKVASLNEEFPPYENLTREAFADPDNKMFPIFSKTAAQISALYVKAQSDMVPFEVKERVQEACDLFDVDEDVVGFKKVAQLVPGLQNEDFIFPEVRKLPAIDQETWEMSKKVFMKVAEEMSFDDVVLGSRRLIKKAYELGVKMNDPILEKLAFLNEHVNRDALCKVAQERFIETADDRYLNISKVASQVSSDSAHFVLRELISIDREHNIDKTASLIQKIALYNKDDIINIDGLEIPVEKIANISTDEWKEVFPYNEIALFDNGASFDKEAFENLFNSLSDIEQDVVKGFIQSKL